MTQKLGLILLSLIVLGGSIWGGYYWMGRAQGAGCAACTTTRVGALASRYAAANEDRAKIQALDQAFSGEYAVICAHLCQVRETLGGSLGSVSSTAVESKPLLDQIMADQGQLEALTWAHLVHLRDALPEKQRADFILAVQKQWQKGMAHMKHQVNECTVHPGMKKQ